MKILLSRIGIFLLLVSFFSCKKDNGPKASDNILNYEIPEVPVIDNYVVGAFYLGFNTFNPAIVEVPVAGKYTTPNGVVPAGVMTQHIDAAVKGGIDYFLFDFRSVNRDVNNWRFDSSLVKSFLDANTANLKFALEYNWSTGSYAVTTASPLENDAVKLEQFFKDIEKVTPYMGNPNYMKVGGKTLLYIRNAQVLFSNNTSAIYATLRTRLGALGFQLYIVGMQDAWTPPARYSFRYQNCVDAVYHQSFSGVGLTSNWDRFYLLPQTMDQNWKYSKDYFSSTLQVDYVPNISPARNPKILNAASTDVIFPRTDNGALFKKLCNVAKMNASSATRMILIDSFNDWANDTQVEPAASYGDSYLQILKSQFKK
jgi:hypothetical protein